MTNFILGAVIGLVIGTIITKRLASSAKTGEAAPFLNKQQIEVKQENLDKIMVAVSKSSKITNDQVQSLLNVSDATAERYLDELEKSGKLAQTASTGRSVTYRKI